MDDVILNTVCGHNFRFSRRKGMSNLKITMDFARKNSIIYLKIVKYTIKVGKYAILCIFTHLKR